MAEGVTRQLTTRRLASRLRLLRQRRGMTARELAELCLNAGAPSLTRSTIAKIESGVRQSTTGHETAVLALVLSESVEHLLAPLSGVDLLADMLHDVRQRSGINVRAWAKAAGLPFLRVKEITLGRLTPEWEELEKLVTAAGGDPATARVVWEQLESTSEPNDLSGSPQSKSATPAVVPRELPMIPPAFVGRADLLHHLDQALLNKVEPSRVAAIVGIAGVGKTALALHWASKVQHLFPDGCLFANLRGFGPEAAVKPVDVLRRFVLALGVPAKNVPLDEHSLAALYRSLLADRRILVVLDNCRSAEQVVPLLPGSGSCRVVVTSRARLDSLSIRYGALHMPVTELTMSDAMDLFARRVGANRVKFEPDATRELVYLCGFLPLAISIVAAKVENEPTRDLWSMVQAIRDRATVLSSLDTGEISMRTTLDWSYQSLDIESATMFRLLGVHPAAEFSLAAAASIAGLPKAETQDMLERLKRLHLVQDQDDRRFVVHDLLHAYAEALLHTSDATECEQAKRRLLEHYLHTGAVAQQIVDPHWEPLELTPPPQDIVVEELDTDAAAASWFVSEGQTLLAVLRRAAAASLHTQVWQLASISATFLYRHGEWRAWVDVLEIALNSVVQTGDRAAEGRIRRMLGSAYARRGDHHQALNQHRQALKLFQAIGDRTGEAHTHLMLGRLLVWTTDAESAVTHTSSALALYRVANLEVWEARALTDLGRAHRQLGDVQTALRLGEQALTMSTEVEDHDGEGATLYLLGEVNRDVGNETRARQCVESSLDKRRGVGDRYGEAESQVLLGEILLHSDRERARVLWEQALSVFEATDRRAEAGQVRTLLAALSETEESHPRAAPGH
jgi:tetratricopeptide (TPR) repeat protein